MRWFLILWAKIQQVASQAITPIIDDVVSTRVDAALSANMGRHLNERIDNIDDGSRFLALWNCVTGLPYDDPQGEGEAYVYSKGMFFLVADIDTTEANKKLKRLVKKAQADPSAKNIDKLTKAVKEVANDRENATNYKPSGTAYVPGVPSTEIETEDVNVGDKYWYSGVSWQLMRSTSAETFFANIRGNATDNSSLASALNGKLSKVETTSTLGQVYTKNQNGSQGMKNISSGTAADTIMARDSNGQSNIADPSSNTHIANKKYVDNKINNSHVLTGEYDDTTGGTFTLNFTTKDTVE